MTIDMVMTVAKETMETTIMIMSPLLGVAMVVGLFIGIIQAVTNIHEQTIAFFPKVFAVVAVFLFCLPWMLQMLISFTQRLFLDFSKYSS